MFPFPCGDGTVADSVLIRLSFSGTCMRPGVIRPQHLEQRRRREPADGEFLRAVAEIAAINVAVHVTVEEIEQFLRKIGRLLSFHRSAPDNWSARSLDDETVPCGQLFVSHLPMRSTASCISAGEPA